MTMSRWKTLTLAILVLLVALPCTVWGQVSSTAQARHVLGALHVIEMVWTTDNAGGDYTATATTWAVDGLVVMAETDPAPYYTRTYTSSTGLFTNATASSATYSPTTLYDITLTNFSGADVFGTALNNRSNTTTELTKPLINGQYDNVPVFGGLTLNITNNSIGDATGVIRIYFYPFRD